MRCLFAVFVVIMSAFAVPVFAEDAVPPNVEKAVDDFNADIVKARKEFDEAVAKAKKRLADKLEREMKSVMRRGNLKGAQVIQELEEKLMQRTGLETVDMMGNPVILNGEAMPGTLYVHADNSAEVFLNGTSILRADSYSRVFNVACTLKPGDILAASFTNTGGPGGFALGFKSEDGATWFLSKADRWVVLEGAAAQNVDMKALRGAKSRPMVTTSQASRIQEIAAQVGGQPESMEVSINSTGTWVLGTVIQNKHLEKSEN